MLRATEYRQMAGRAGRAGIDTQGEAILMANNPNLGKQLLQLMQVSRVVSWQYLTPPMLCCKTAPVSKHRLIGSDDRDSIVELHEKPEASLGLPKAV